MALVITDVPEKIARADYMALVRSIGLNPKDLVSLTFGATAITAVVIARNADGHPYPEPFNGNIATHHIQIPVED